MWCGPCRRRRRRRCRRFPSAREVSTPGCCSSFPLAVLFCFFCLVVVFVFVVLVLVLVLVLVFSFLLLIVVVVGLLQSSGNEVFGRVCEDRYMRTTADRPHQPSTSALNQQDTLDALALTCSGKGSPLSTFRKYFWAWVRIWRIERVLSRPEITSQFFPNCLSPRRKRSCSVLVHRPVLKLAPRVGTQE